MQWPPAAIYRHASTQPSTDRLLDCNRSNHYRSTVICRSTTDQHAISRLYIRTAVSTPTFYWPCT
eukprot:993282-Pleurochrysis_carterae.AAC.1